MSCGRLVEEKFNPESPGIDLDTSRSVNADYPFLYRERKL